MLIYQTSFLIKRENDKTGRLNKRMNFKKSTSIKLTNKYIVIEKLI